MMVGMNSTAGLDRFASQLRRLVTATSSSPATCGLINFSAREISFVTRKSTKRDGSTNRYGRESPACRQGSRRKSEYLEPVSLLCR